LKIIKQKLANKITLNLIPTTKFKTSVVNISFKGKFNPKELTGLNVLSKILSDSTQKYPKAEMLVKQMNYLFGTDININSQIVGKMSLFSVSATFLDPKLVASKFKLLHQVFELIHEMIYQPKLENGHFEQDTFDKLKTNHLYRLKALENDKESVASIRLKELVDGDHPFKYLSLGNLKDLESLTNHDLVKIYQNLLKRDIEIFVLGDVKNEEVKKLVSKYFKGNNQNLKIQTLVKLNQTKSIKVIEQRQFNQSQLQYLLTTNTLVGTKDYYPMIMFNAIFGSTPLSKLFRVVREQYSLCYSIRSSYQSNYGLITVGAGIDAKNYQLTDRLIRKQLLEMKQGKFSQDDLDMNRKMLITIMEHTFDQPTSLVSHILTSSLIGADVKKELFIKNLKKVTKKDVLRVAKKVNLKIAYFLKQGDKK
jgi:predicted Zn-dependent peptidase